MRVCAELIDLGMDLARLAAARARTELADPDAQPATPEPGSLPAAEMETALVGTLRRAIKSYTKAPTTQPRPEKPATAAQIFVRLTAAIRACVTLEARLAAGLQSAPQAAPRSRTTDPRRATLLDGFRLVTKTHPERIDLMRETTARLDDELAADPDQKSDIPELFFRVCDAAGIEIDLATLPDTYLGVLPGKDPAPDPRATSPP